MPCPPEGPGGWEGFLGTLGAWGFRGDSRLVSNLVLGLGSPKRLQSCLLGPPTQGVSRRVEATESPAEQTTGPK
jgi:hypothetical protein